LDIGYSVFLARLPGTSPCFKRYRYKTKLNGALCPACHSLKVKEENTNDKRIDMTPRPT
jgi:hypothetical protein